MTIVRQFILVLSFSPISSTTRGSESFLGIPFPDSLFEPTLLICFPGLNFLFELVLSRLVWNP